MNDTIRRCALLVLLLTAACKSHSRDEGASEIDRVYELNRAIDEAMCECLDERAACLAEVADDYESPSAQRARDCYGSAYPDHRDALAEFVDCQLETQEAYRSCLESAACDPSASTACEDTYFEASDACPVSDADLQAFLDDVNACIGSVPAGTCPELSASGTGELLTVNTSGFGGDHSLSCGGSGADVSVTWTAPTSGTFVVTTEGSEFDTVLGVLAGCSGPELACDDDGGATELASRLEFEATAGTEYVFVIAGFGGETGLAVLTVTPG